MRAPVRSEADAFWLVIATVVVLGLSVFVGYLAGWVPAVAVVVFALVVWLAWDVADGGPAWVLRDAEAIGHRDGVHARRLLLVVANVTPPGDMLAREIMRAGEPPPVLEVLAPVLGSRTHFVTTDVDHETRDARRRLNDILAWAGERGLVAHGHLGDPIAPIAGLSDQLRRYDVDEIIVTTHAPDDANWVETTLLHDLRDQTQVPVHELVVGA